MKLNRIKNVSFDQAYIFGLLALGILSFPAKMQAVTPNADRYLARPAIAAPITLDAKHLQALSMLETGDDDRAVGLAGEVSRYQLMPSVWKTYSQSVAYQNPGVASQVARQHWNYLAAYFKEKTGRQPADFDMYVLWNTRFGYYARHGFSKNHLAAVVMDRAERFVNLVNRPEKTYASN